MYEVPKSVLQRCHAKPLFLEQLNILFYSLRGLEKSYDESKVSSHLTATYGKGSSGSTGG